jgi:hypothetical protein
VQPLKSQGPPASVGRRRGQTRSCGRGLRLKAEGPSPSASHPLLAPTAQRLQCNAMQCVQPGLTPADRRLPVTATEGRGQRTEDRGQSRRIMCAEYRSLCPCLSSADGCTRCEVRCSIHGEGGRRALAVATVSQTALTRMPTRDEHSAIPSNPQRFRRHSVGTRLRRTTSPRPMCLPRQAPRLLLASLRLPDRLAC